MKHSKELNTMEFFKNDGHLNVSGISLYADAIKLDKVQDLPKYIASHMADCRICQQEVIEVTSILADLDQSGSGEHPYFKSEKPAPVNGNKKSTINRIYKLAAAAVIGFILFFAYQQFFQKEMEPEMVDREKEINQPMDKDPVDEKEIVIEDKSGVPANNEKVQKEESPQINEEAKPEAETKYLANFMPNEELESMINAVYRSELIKVKQPMNTSEFKNDEKILFSWEINNSVKLSILDNAENLILEEENAVSPFKLDRPLDPGLYYWKIETEQDLLYLGKFTRSVQ